MLKSQIALLVAMVVFAASFTALADSGKEESLVEIAREIFPDFLANQTYETAAQPLVTPFGEGSLTVFTNTRGEEIGYIISVDDTILEFSESPSPYRTIELKEGESLYYDPATYSKINSDVATKILAAPQSLEDQTEENAIPPMTRAVNLLSNVTCNLKGNYDSVVAALSNVMWYWGGHGYSSLTSGMLFSEVEDEIDYLFNGSYSSSNVLSVANTYAGMCTSSNYFTGGATWYPNYYDAYTEIDAGYPCMVNFASGNLEYSGAHMTMCCGYSYSVNGNFLYLVDGYSTSIVTKLWTSYNDCVIKLRIH